MRSYYCPRAWCTQVVCRKTAEYLVLKIDSVLHMGTRNPVVAKRKYFRKSVFLVSTYYGTMLLLVRFVWQRNSILTMTLSLSRIHCETGANKQKREQVWVYVLHCLFCFRFLCASYIDYRVVYILYAHCVRSSDLKTLPLLSTLLLIL